nr:MAG TPA: BRO family protein [Caudoviricetes sp.]
MVDFFVIFFHKKFGVFKNCCTFAPLLDIEICLFIKSIHIKKPYKEIYTMSKSNLVGFYLFYFKVMQEKLKIFENPEFGQVRVIVQENNEPLFCLADICRILSIGNPSRLKERLEEEGVQLIENLIL